jgi:hypothetical protein
MVGEVSAGKEPIDPEGLPGLVIEDAAILKQNRHANKNHPNIKLVSSQLTIALILNPQACQKVHGRFCTAEID